MIHRRKWKSENTKSTLTERAKKPGKKKREESGRRKGKTPSKNPGCDYTVSLCHNFYPGTVYQQKAFTT